MAALGIRPHDAAAEGQAAACRLPAGREGAGEADERRDRVAAAHSKRFHSPSYVLTRTWSLRRFTGASSTRATSGPNTKSPGRRSVERARRPSGRRGFTSGGFAAARTNPQSPKDGTAMWYGRVAKPAARSVASTIQKLRRAKRGDVDWTESTPSGSSFRFTRE